MSLDGAVGGYYDLVCGNGQKQLLLRHLKFYSLEQLPFPFWKALDEILDSIPPNWRRRRLKELALIGGHRPGILFLYYIDWNG